MHISLPSIRGVRSVFPLRLPARPLGYAGGLVLHPKDDLSKLGLVAVPRVAVVISILIYIQAGHRAAVHGIADPRLLLRNVTHVHLVIHAVAVALGRGGDVAVLARRAVKRRPAAWMSKRKLVAVVLQLGVAARLLLGHVGRHGLGGLGPPLVVEGAAAFVVHARRLHARAVLRRRLPRRLWYKCVLVVRFPVPINSVIVQNCVPAPSRGAIASGGTPPLMMPHEYVTILVYGDLCK
mmetsp:Transcript_25803/g.48974  ORF Transcript_25803/g.48974 Transcript_25803/m.48974 type:complete len:237 (-) Transcript_25803:109-819(-)